MSDDMGMAAIRAHYTQAEAVELAILAGVDLLALAHRYATADIVERIVDRVQQGRIPPGTVDESYRRLMRLKRLIPTPPTFRG
jgi:beta-glucosidase-like glycosyl hydrolase